MSKAILILNKMPKSCANCPVCAWSEETGLYNCLNGTKEEKCVDEYLLYDISDKPSWCPLKPLPQKKNAFEEWMKVERLYRGQYVSKELENQVIGYNYCLDEILGEEENV